MTTPLRVFLADDHPIVRDGLRGLIEAQPDMQVVGEACDGASAVAGVIAFRPDVAVLDMSMPQLSGAQAAEQLRREGATAKVLALSAHEDRGYVQQMLAAGAAGYVVKRTAADELVRAIRVVASGQVYLDPIIASALVADLSRPPGSPEPAAESELSEREDAVLRRIASGLPVKQIAADLAVGARTVETYRARAMEKLGLRNRADIVRYAVRQGWLVES
ncbi:MAG: response regulator transcription factor [Myxococcales bacterium]|nr:MAG: response regulator transcription factor [Myxococcales bacterium]